MGSLLLVTGTLAEAEVREAASKLGADVAIVPISVAQFMSQKMAADAVKGTGKRYERVVLPGLVRFDAGAVESLTKMPCFKGPKHASDLYDILSKGAPLSKSEPADSLFGKKGLEDAGKLFLETDKRLAKFKIGSLKVGVDLPPRIIAEIVDAPMLSDAQALKRAEYYIASGADIIDVGAIAAEDNSKRLSEIVKLLKSKIGAPISIDSLNPNEINAAIKSGADLVLSVCKANIEKVEKKPGVAYVIIPDDGKGDLGENVRIAEEAGFENIIADPILSPPFRTAESLSKYSSFRKTHPHHLMMAGAGNVTELIDADSTGANALIASMAVELGISLLLTTENSGKTRGAIRELKRAIDMCFFAKAKGSLPKDLGFDLLMAKGKGKGELFYPPGAKPAKVAASQSDFKPDPKGLFTIFVDFDKGMIVAAHAKAGKYDIVIESESAEALSKKIIDKGLVSDMKHAAYLGRELAKAEVCLRQKKAYTQDEGFLGL